MGKTKGVKKILMLSSEDVSTVVARFCTENNLSDNKRKKLETILKQKMSTLGLVQ
jgi:transcription initiation factor TFIIIB Brf1 subunit/transcription initiation factor TFIIB